MLERNKRREIDLTCRYEGCGKICRNKAGLTIHQKRMHRAANDRVKFVCDLCHCTLETMAAKIAHEKTCTGGRREVDGKRECGKCLRRISKNNYARHVKGCREEDDREEDIDDEERVGRKTRCRYCQRLLSYSNMARHERTCLLWDPGGGPNPV